jgi:hypothetical protein
VGQTITHTSNEAELDRRQLGLCLWGKMINGFAYDFQAPNDGELFLFIGSESLFRNPLGKGKDLPGVDQNIPEECFLSAGNIKFPGIREDQFLPNGIRILLQCFAFDEINFASEQARQLFFKIIYKGKMRHALRRTGREGHQEIQITIPSCVASGHGAENFQADNRPAATETLQCRPKSILFSFR